MVTSLCVCLSSVLNHSVVCIFVLRSRCPLAHFASSYPPCSLRGYNWSDGCCFFRCISRLHSHIALTPLHLLVSMFTLSLSSVPPSTYTIQTDTPHHTNSPMVQATRNDTEVPSSSSFGSEPRPTGLGLLHCTLQHFPVRKRLRFSLLKIEGKRVYSITVIFPFLCSHTHSSIFYRISYYFAASVSRIPL